METIHVKIDKLTTIASEHDNLEPVSQRFINNDSSAESMNTPSKKDFDNLFGPMYEEYFEKRSSDESINSAAYQYHSWIESMQDELHQFERLDVWELVPRLDGKNIIAVKWLGRKE
ncbi:hypothetical protein Tco_0434384 [Tanacetum coccineum]